MAERSRLRRVLRWTAIAAACACGGSILEVVAARFVNPPFTLTMVGAMWDHYTLEGELAGYTYTPRSLAALGDPVARAAVSSEDARFFLHDGFDWEAICGALDDYGDGKLRGGSTISQQVARNVFLWQERSWLRKGLETWYTFWLELLVPKQRILELYLNVAETGPMTFGFEAGAERWYHQPASSLTRAQAAGLAAILPSPRKWSPTRAPASTRAAWILANPAPFPGDKGFDALVEKWDREGRGPWMCAPR